MTFQVIRPENIEYVVAPYEADAQFAYLCSLEPENSDYRRQWSNGIWLLSCCKISHESLTWGRRRSTALWARFAEGGLLLFGGNFWTTTHLSPALKVNTESIYAAHVLGLNKKGRKKEVNESSALRPTYVWEKGPKFIRLNWPAITHG